MSRADIMADVPEDFRPEAADWKSWNWSRLKSERESVMGARPMLLLYPIDRQSEPSAKGTKDSQRVSLDAEHDVLGIGVLFPQLGINADKKPTKYIQVNLRHGGFLTSEDDDEVTSDAN